MKKIKNILLTMMSIFVIVMTFPFYIIYSFGKVLCDTDEMIIFYDSLFKIIHRAKNYNVIIEEYNKVKYENDALKEYIKELKNK